jgi:thiamine biosynthesis lipoprotein
MSVTLCVHIAILAVQTAAWTPPTGIPGVGEQRFEFEESHMGTGFRLVFFASDSLTARTAADAAFGRVRELDQVLSDYRRDSEVSHLADRAGSGEAVRISRDLRRVLERSLDVSRESSGAFDITIGPLTRLWRWAMRRGVVPDEERIREARSLVGFEEVHLEGRSSTVRLGRAGMRLDVGGIGKGYAADEALTALRSHGIRRAMVDAGGDLVMAEAPPGARGWRIEVSSLDADGTIGSEILVAANEAVASSGDRYRFVEVDGVRYSHVIDPVTGYGVRDLRVVTVRAEAGWRADAVASAIAVLGAPAGIDLARNMTGIEARVIQQSGEDSFVVLETEFFARSSNSAASGVP